jgi:hypothetical protein
MALPSFLPQSSTVEFRNMSRRLVVLAAFVSLACVAAVVWLATPAADGNRDRIQGRPVSALRSQAEDAQASPEAPSPANDGAEPTVSPGDGTKTVRPDDGNARRFPLAAEPTAHIAQAREPERRGTIARYLAPPPTNFLPEPGSRIRLLPAKDDVPQNPQRGITVAVDRSLHDPAAWMESDQSLGAAQQSVKSNIADRFAAEVASTVEKPDAVSHDAMERAWREARMKADWEYRMFFGDEAANRAGLNAGRSAMSRP